MIRLRIGASGNFRNAHDDNRAIADMVTALENYAQSANRDLKGSAQKMTVLLERMAVAEQLKRRYDNFRR